MTGKRVFFLSFFLTFFVMLCSFIGLYWVLDITPRETVGTQQKGVPILKAGIDDSKTLLLCAKNESTEFFFLIKFNALQNKVSVVSMPRTFRLSLADRTLSQSLEYAGMLQCVYDLKQQFDIAVDYHLLCDYEKLGSIIGSFCGFHAGELGGSIPPAAQELLFKSNDYIDATIIIDSLKYASQDLDNPLGLDFLNKSACSLLKYNLANLKDYGIDSVKENFSHLTTNFNVQSLNKMHRILSLLLENSVTFDCLVLSDEKTAQDQLHSVLKE
ncbi:MAG: hypothetical protein RR827_02400 [Oscillospiraceae bacterium]